jgi:hypothetical protein
MENTSGIMDVDDTNGPETEAPPALFHDVFFTIVPTDLLVATALDVSLGFTTTTSYVDSTRSNRLLVRS